MSKSARLIGITLISIASAVTSVPSFAQPLSAEAIMQAISTDKRTAGEAARDEGRNPGAVLSFLGLARGMKVLDVMAAAGWYTEVISLSLGDTGTVYSQNAPATLKMRGGAYDKALTERLANGRLPNVVRVDRDLKDLGLAGEIDLALTALNLHDLYNRDPDSALAMLVAVKEALKPGGVLGIVDHIGLPGGDNAKLHRMTKEQAVALAEKAGFTVESSDALRNPADDHSKMVFDPSIRGHTDRFLLKLTKPEAM